MGCVRYQDHPRRLVFFETGVSSAHWDAHWERHDLRASVTESTNRFVLRETQSVLPQGSRILEGGCGIADKVYSLGKAGYPTTGLDYATETIYRTHQVVPELPILVGDIEKLPFQDAAFDGYWSLGVLEHFRSGFEPSASEIARTLRPGGFLFLTMPALSPLRKLKISLGRYEVSTEGKWPDFYQFAYAQDTIEEVFEALGFRRVRFRYYDAVKGLKDEIPWLKPGLQRIYDSHSLAARVCRGVTERLLSPLTGHMYFFVFQKLEQDTAPRRAHSTADP